MKKYLLFLLSIPTLCSAQSLRLQLVADAPPGLSVSPTTLTATSNVVGVQGTSSMYTLTWSTWTYAADTVTAPTGYVVSSDNSTFATSVKVSTPGASGSLSLWVALSTAAPVGTNAGNIQHKSGTVIVNLPITGTTNGTAALGITPSTLTLTDTTGSSGYPQGLTASFSFLTSSITCTFTTNTTPLDVSLDGGTTWHTSAFSFSGTSPIPILVRVNAAATAGTISDVLTFSAAGVSNVIINIGGLVSTLSGTGYKTIQIPTTSVASNLTNFPVLVSETSTYLKTVGNGGSVINSSGFDITFSSDQAGTSPLNWEVETYDPVNGVLIAWVKIPTVSSTSTTTFYMHFGQSGISTFQGGSQGVVWDANYSGVWHMNQVLTGSGQSELDYTSNGNNYTSHGTWGSGQTVSGPVGSAIQSLKANSDYLQNVGAGGLSADFTIEGWFNISVADNTSFTFGSPSFANNMNWFSATGRVYDGGSDHIVSGATTSINIWVHYVITRSGTNYVWYQNGAQNNTSTHTLFTFNFQDLFINLTGVYSSNIIADEVRISTIARSAAWVGAEYLNMNSPHTFYTIH